MAQQNHFFYLKVVVLVILIVSLVYVLSHKPEETVVVTRVTDTGEERTTIMEVDKAPTEPVHIEVIVPAEENPDTIQVEEPVIETTEEPTPVPEEPAVETTEEPEPVEEDLVSKHNIPQALQTGLVAIEELTADVVRVEKHMSDGSSAYYVYVPSKEETTQIEDGTFKFIHAEETFYFVNGLYYPYEEFKIFKIEDEINRLLGRNLNYRESNELEKIIYVCQVTDTSFIALIGSETSYDKAQLYFFDEEVDKVRFYSIDEEEAETLGSGIECVS